MQVTEMGASPLLSVEDRVRLAGHLGVVDEMARAYGVSRADVLGRFRYKSVSKARKAVWSYLRATTELSYPQIGALFDRDHTTIIAGVRSFHRGEKKPLMKIRVPEFLELGMVGT